MFFIKIYEDTLIYNYSSITTARIQKRRKIAMFTPTCTTQHTHQTSCNRHISLV